jgi:hypothetical protein
MTAPKTPDELADALWKKKQLYGAPSASKAELRQLARDAAALGAVKALEAFAKSLAANRPDLAGLANYITTEVAATYADQEQGE